MANRTHEGIRIVIEIDVNDRDRFKTLVEKAVEIVRQDEPETVIYDFYLDEEARTARLYEAYTSVSALVKHTEGRVFTELGAEFLEVCRFAQIDVFGDPGEMRERPTIGPTRFWGSAFAGLSRV